MKKALKITGIVIASLLLILLLLPFALKGKIADIVKVQANKNLNATVAFEDAGLSFLRNFPHLTAYVSELSVVNKAPFEGDTLFSAQKVSVTVNLKSLLSGNQLTIGRIGFYSPRLQAIVLSDGRANWDITLPTEEPEISKSEESSLSLSLEKIDISHAYISYNDQPSDMIAEISDWSGTLSGNLSADRSLIRTQSEITSLSFIMAKIPYLNKVRVVADISVDADLENSSYTFSENSLRLNDLESSFEGWVKMPDTSRIEMDLSLQTGEVTLKNLLSLVPAIYSSHFSTLETSGLVTLKAWAKGILKGEEYPAFDALITVQNGMFRYPSLPGSVTSIFIDSHISNPGGALDLTVIDLSRFEFIMGGNPMKAKAHITTPMSDPNLKGQLQGILDLGKVREVYPLGDSVTLQGRFEADIAMEGALSSIEKERYDQFNASGTMTVSQLAYHTPDLPEIAIEEAKLRFTSKEAELTAFSMKVGKNDFQANGKIGNPLPYFMADGTLKGTLNVTSNYLNINDFMKEEVLGPEVAPSTPDQIPADSVAVLAFDIPKNLDFVLTAKANEVLFDKLSLKNLNGSVRLLNGRLTFQDVKAQALGGSMAINGYYETPDPSRPYVEMGLALDSVSFAQTYTALDMAKSLAPIFDKVGGNYSMNLKFNSSLTGNMDPIITSLTGNGLLQSSNVNVSDIAVLNALATALNNDALRALSTKDIKIPFKIEQGRVVTSPFTIDVNQTKLLLSGSTGIDQTIDYQLKVTLPAQLAKQGLNTLQGTIGGTFTSPKVSIDMADLAKQALVGAAGKLLGSIAKDSTGTASVAALSENLQQRADQLRTQAKEAGDKMIEEADKQGKLLIEKAENPILKATARAAAARLKSEAEKRSAQLQAEADAKAKALLEPKTP